MGQRQIFGTGGITQSDTAATANALMERESDGSSYQTISRSSLGNRSSGHVWEGVLASQVTGFTVDESTKNATFYPLDATAGALTVTLPAASGFTGKVLKFKKTDSSANAVIIDGSTTETIDGALKFALYRQYACVELMCDGTGWQVVNPESRLALAAAAASTAVTNTVAETAFDNVSFSIAADTTRSLHGDTYRIRAQGIATATNGTDTLTVKVKIGATVIVTTGAVDVANNDIWTIDLMLTVRANGGSGTLVAHGTQILAAEGTAPKNFKLASTAVDTTAAQAITCTAQWSVANAGNSCRLDNFTIEKLAA